MSKCEVCEGQAQLFLCITHINALRETLQDLPWWLDRCKDAAAGQAKLGDGGRRGSRARDFDEYTGPDGADKLEEALAKGKFKLDRMLATGRVNGKASRLLDRATNDLGTWVRHLCETRKLETPRLSATGCAEWLAAHAHAIASDEAAASCYTSVVNLTDDIRRVVNRPEPPRFCGPCSTELTDEQRAKLVEKGQEDRTHCRVQIYAKRGASRVACPECGTEHDVAELEQLMLTEADEYSFTISDLVDYILPKVDVRVPKRTLQHWAKVGDIEATGFVSNVPRYQLGQVREIARRRGRAPDPRKVL